jgi:hypothetical protein
MTGAGRLSAMAGRLADTAARQRSSPRQRSSARRARHQILARRARQTPARHEQQQRTSSEAGEVDEDVHPAGGDVLHDSGDRRVPHHVRRAGCERQQARHARLHSLAQGRAGQGRAGQVARPHHDGAVSINHHLHLPGRTSSIGAATTRTTPSTVPLRSSGATVTSDGSSMRLYSSDSVRVRWRCGSVRVR